MTSTTVPATIYLEDAHHAAATAAGKVNGLLSMLELSQAAIDDESKPLPELQLDSALSHAYEAIRLLQDAVSTMQAARSSF